MPAVRPERPLAATPLTPSTPPPTGWPAFRPRPPAAAPYFPPAVRATVSLGPLTQSAEQSYSLWQKGTSGPTWPDRCATPGEGSGWVAVSPPKLNSHRQRLVPRTDTSPALIGGGEPTAERPTSPVSVALLWAISTRRRSLLYQHLLDGESQSTTQCARLLRCPRLRAYWELALLAHAGLVHRQGPSTWIATSRPVAVEPSDLATPLRRHCALRAAAASREVQVERFRAFARRYGQESERWRRTATFDQTRLHLAPEDAEALHNEILALTQRYSTVSKSSDHGGRDFWLCVDLTPISSPTARYPSTATRLLATLKLPLLIKRRHRHEITATRASTQSAPTPLTSTAAST